MRVRTFGFVGAASLAAATAATVAVAASAPPAAGGRLQITEGNAGFPNRIYILSLPTNATLQTRDVRVRENGGRVSRLQVVPARDAGSKQLGVVLVIDTSNSMRGEPIAGAMAAARAFASHRNARQQLAVVTFNSKARVLLPFTSDQAAIDEALATAPPLAQGTHIYDGASAALALFEESRIGSGTIVVLSDGADTGSVANRDQLAQGASARHVRVFAVGLESKEFDEKALRRLADAAGGRYSQAASSAELAELYGALGSQLANEYLLRYRSLAGPSTRVSVEVRVRGIRGVARGGYVTPALPKLAPAAPYSRPLGSRFWRSPLTLVLIAAIAAGSLALGLLVLLRPRSPALRKRMAEFVSVAEPGEPAESSPVLTQRLLSGTERSLHRTRWWTRFKEELELAEINTSAAQIAVWTVIGTVFAMIALRLLLGHPVFAVLGLAVPLAVRAVIKRQLKRVRDRFADQLPDNIQVLSSALRAGHGFVGALSIVMEDAEEPSKREFRRVVADDQLGVPIEQTLDAVAVRMACSDLEQVAVVAALGRQTGGNTAEVLDRVTESIQERSRLRREIMTLTAQGRLSRWIVSALPVVLALAILLLNPTYLDPLFNEPTGRILLLVAASLVVLGSWVIKKIVEIEV